MQNLRVSLVQGATRWHDPAGNRDYYGSLIAPLAGRTDLVVLPGDVDMTVYFNDQYLKSEDATTTGTLSLQHIDTVGALKAALATGV